jgi:hypothetical protein
MKPTTLRASRFGLVIAALALTVGLISWDHRQTPGYQQAPVNDTVPKTKTDRDKKIRDLDDALEELNAIDLKEVMQKAQLEMEKAMKELDGNKIRLEVEKAMKDIDFDKLQKEISESMSKVDLEKIKTELAEAMKEIDMSKIQAELKESMSKIDMDKIRVEMEKVKNIDMKELEVEMQKLKEEMKEIGPRIEKEMANAKVEIEKAKAEIREFKGFVDGLDKDGLINKKEAYTLKHQDGELFINGKKASEQVYNKYRSFLEKHKKFNIEKSDDDFDIDMD